MSEEIAQLKSFTNYVVRNDLMNSGTNNIVERSKQQLDGLRERIARLSKQAHYENYVAEFQAPEAMEVPDDVMEEYKEKFTVKNFKEDLTSVFPVLYRLMKEEESVGYDDIVGMIGKEEAEVNQETVEAEHPMAKFEAWVDSLGEESAIQSSDEEEQKQAVQKLQELVKQHFPAGTDGSNAINGLEGIIDDPKLEADIKKKASEDPDQCVRPLIKAWIEENAPEVLDQLDFGDMVDEPAVGADQVEPQQEEGNEFSKKVQDLKAQGAKKGTKFKTSDGEEHTLEGLAEFINSFYDKETGTFPKGPEGVCTMVGKKFGEQAEMIARKFVERMAPHQEQGAEELEELERIKQLSMF